MHHLRPQENLEFYITQSRFDKLSHAIFQTSHLHPCRKMFTKQAALVAEMLKFLHMTFLSHNFAQNHANLCLRQSTGSWVCDSKQTK